ncbi:hypothetical protein BDQ17DRAFT_1329583 [Cyathus striatus]|nr:hypothetical protein BDQ17DRAFT_1329583 [Cyathus striatus]
MRRGFLLQASRKSPREDVSTSNAAQARIPSSDYQVAQLITFNESPSDRWGFTPELQSLPNETSTLPPGGFILCRLPPGNDSCRPNIIATFHTASFTYHFRAARPIAEGEEITYCYAAIDAPHIVRTEDLMKFYRFKCTCDSCISPTHESDITRTTMFTRVKALEERFQQFRSPIGNPYDGPERRVVSREAYLLVLEMQGEELHASEAYVRAVKIVSLSYVRLAQDMRSRLNVDITKIDELSTLLTTGLRVVRAHRGEEHEDYVHMSSMARELGM